MSKSSYEFFAGGGMARLGLGPDWRCLFANDCDRNKIAVYKESFGAESPLLVDDVARLRPDQLPGQADLAWASFPCQDLSLAGGGAGLAGSRSGALWACLELLFAQDKTPRLIVLENVPGLVTSKRGQDLAAIGRALAGAGYRYGGLVIDAVHFVPQSRPRLFIVAVRQDAELPAAVVADEPDGRWHPEALCGSPLVRDDRWAWWRLPDPPSRNKSLVDVLEEQPWHSPDRTADLLALMSPLHRDKVEEAKAAGSRVVGTVFRRTRVEDGRKVQRAEVRFDGVAGCLRTPAGGSSRQILLVVEGDCVRSRLLSPREAARLMGLPDEYVLPSNANQALHLLGDGVVVPVVRFLAAHLLEPLLRAAPAENRPAHHGLNRRAAGDPSPRVLRGSDA